MFTPTKTNRIVVATLLTLFVLQLCVVPRRLFAASNSYTNFSWAAALDSMPPRTDSVTGTAADTLATPPKKPNELSAPIAYQAADSVVFDGKNLAYMYGQGVVKFQDIQLDAAVIEMNIDSSRVFAEGVTDSIGEVSGLPVFKDPSGEYESKTLKYSFATQKGYITNIVTQQGEGFLTGGQTKKTETDALYMNHGRYTTCDDHDCPHFYLQLTKAKVIPNKNIVTGPAYLVLGGVPLPIGVPFGFFPFTKTYSSGVIMPTYGEETTRGFYLRNGGYYFAMSDYMDLALTGELYSKGSWGVNAQSNYAKRYKFSGSFNVGYLTTITGDKGMPDYAKMTNFRLGWTHRQDVKANPNMTFSASVNYTTSGYDRNNLDSYYNPNSFTQNTKSSTVNMTYRFPELPLSLSASANITQRSQDSTLAVSLPDFTLSMSRIYPLKRKTVIGKERWYEKIYMSYTGTFRNSITTKQDQIFNASLVRDWKNAMQHQIPLGATFSLFNYINISPSFSFTDRMYSNRVDQAWNYDTNRLMPTDTIYGFYNVYNFNTSVSAQTKLYGFYKPLPFLGLKRIEAIRHVFTPSVSFSYAPDFSNPRFGAWKEVTYTNATTGEEETVQYSPFSHGMYGTAPRGKSGVVSFNMQNNIEMKVKSDRDSTGVRKISLIENLGANISYNMAADSMRWSNLNTNILLRLTKSFNLSLSGVFDTYTYQLNEYGNPVRVNIPRWEAGKGFGRLMSTGTSFSYTFNNDSYKRLSTQFNSLFNKKEEGEEESSPSANTAVSNNSGGGDSENEGEYDRDGYMRWSVPWSLTLNYSANYGYGEFNREKMEYDSKITQNFSFSGSITPSKNWSFNFSSSYDFERKKISYMNCNVSRNLHCWTMTASFIPVGPYKSYNFHISVNAAMLKDLKYDKQSNVYDKMDWY